MMRTKWAAGVAAAVLVLAGAAGRARPQADDIEDGVYLLRFEGEGRKVTLTDGSEGVLGKRLSAGIGTAVTLKSWTNDNTRYHLHVKGLGPLPEEATKAQTALVVDGVVLHVGRPEKLAAGGTAEVGATVYTAAAARALAARYRITPELRKHPGHRFEARWTPDKPRYQVGEPVTLKLALKNTGTEPFRFTFGGHQRGPRDNQFRFIAQVGANGKALPDTGDAVNFGGISTSKTLRRGEVFRTEVDVSKWFTFPGPGTYRVTGILELPMIDADGEDIFGPVVWDDLAVGECDVVIVARGP